MMTREMCAQRLEIVRVWVSMGSTCACLGSNHAAPNGNARAERLDRARRGLSTPPLGLVNAYAHTNSSSPTCLGLSCQRLHRAEHSVGHMIRDHGGRKYNPLELFPVRELLALPRKRPPPLASYPDQHARRPHGATGARPTAQELLTKPLRRRRLGRRGTAPVKFQQG